MWPQAYFLQRPMAAIEMTAIDLQNVDEMAAHCKVLELPMEL